MQTRNQVSVSVSDSKTRNGGNTSSIHISLRDIPDSLKDVKNVTVSIRDNKARVVPLSENGYTVQAVNNSKTTRCINFHNDALLKTVRKFVGEYPQLHEADGYWYFILDERVDKVEKTPRRVKNEETQKKQQRVTMGSRSCAVRIVSYNTVNGFAVNIMFKNLPDELKVTGRISAKSYLDKIIFTPERSSDKGYKIVGIESHKIIIQNKAEGRIMYEYVGEYPTLHYDAEREYWYLDRHECTPLDGCANPDDIVIYDNDGTATYICPEDEKYEETKRDIERIKKPKLDCAAKIDIRKDYGLVVAKISMLKLPETIAGTKSLRVRIDNGRVVIHPEAYANLVTYDGSLATIEVKGKNAEQFVPFEGKYGNIEQYEEGNLTWYFTDKVGENKPSEEPKMISLIDAIDNMCKDENKTDVVEDIEVKEEKPVMDNIKEEVKATGAEQTITGIKTWIKECVDNDDFETVKELMTHLESINDLVKRTQIKI